MLKSKVESLKEKKELPFPKLMVGKESYTIIFAIEPSSNTHIRGVVMVDDVEPLGCEADDWVASCFTDFYGSITLTQTQE